jgi:protein SCO1/2
MKTLLFLIGILASGAFNALAETPEPMDLDAIIAENPWVPRDPRAEPFLRVEFRPQLNTDVPLDLQFMGDDGMRTTLRERMIPGKPAVLLLMYYRCPTICGLALQGLLNGFEDIDLVPGHDFTVLVVSFDHTETHVTAAQNKFNSLEAYGNHDHADGWHFMVGNEPEVLELTRAVNFGFKFDPADNQFSHGSGLLVLTPEGRISRFLPGVVYSRTDLQLSLVQASEGRIGSWIDRLALLCYEYNPETGRYGLLINRIVLVACLITIASVAWLIIGLLRIERRRDAAAAGASS